MRKYLGGTLALSLAWPYCALADQASQPETVVVTAQPSGNQTLIDRKVYSISKDLQSNFGTAADVLNNIPSVTVDTDGNVSLRNDSNVTILIDGKPSTQFSGSTGGLSLQELSASDIDRVEILDESAGKHEILRLSRRHQHHHQETSPGGLLGRCARKHRGRGEVHRRRRRRL